MRALATMTRTWPMLAALGGGLVLAALAAGAGGAPRVVLAGLGIAALGWGVSGLRAGRVVAPRTTLAASTAALVAGGAAVAGGGLSAVPGLPLGAAAVFTTAVAVSAASAVRSTPRERTARPRATGSARSLAGLAVGAVLVSALATPALAATDAGRLAVPHGELHVRTGHAH
ncbi:hypothetical protein [Agromyces sp. SYSU T0242]|uniref:hypothetical protein n=1 Tax=Agromyces litoreus TaxID=3158561 RepID=UPI0033911466